MFRLDVPHTRPALKTHEKHRIFINWLRSSLNQQLPRYKQKATLILVVVIICLYGVFTFYSVFCLCIIKTPTSETKPEEIRVADAFGGVLRVNPKNSDQHTKLENKTIESFVWINKNSEIANIRIAVEFRLSQRFEHFPE